MQLAAHFVCQLFLQCHAIVASSGSSVPHSQGRDERTARKRIGIFDESRLRLRVLPNNLDLNFHMNNGRFLTLMDVARALVRAALRDANGAAPQPEILALVDHYEPSPPLPEEIQ